MSVGEGEKLQNLGVSDVGANSEFTDQSMVCIDCRLSFIWTVGEQTFYRDKGLLNPPKRCKPCKKLKNERLAAIETAHTTGKPHRIEVAAECACCSTVTTVPFYPSQGRPVYCRSCYQKQNGNSGGGDRSS